MKYLKKFNESIDEIEQNLTDICLELQDDGFEVLVSKTIQSYIISMRKPKRIFLLNSITEYKERLIDYMESEGYQCEIYVNNPVTDKDMELYKFQELLKSTKGLRYYYWHDGYINRIKFKFE